MNDLGTHIRFDHTLQSKSADPLRSVQEGIPAATVEIDAIRFLSPNEPSKWQESEMEQRRRWA